MAAIEPNQTVYINNLNEKIKKDGASRDRAPDARTPQRSRPFFANISSRTNPKSR